MDGAGSYSVAHRAGLLPTELTGMWGWVLPRSPHQGRGLTPSPRAHSAKACCRDILEGIQDLQAQPQRLTAGDTFNAENEANQKTRPPPPPPPPAAEAACDGQSLCRGVPETGGPVLFHASVPRTCHWRPPSQTQLDGAGP